MPSPTSATSTRLQVLPVLEPRPGCDVSRGRQPRARPHGRAQPGAPAQDRAQHRRSRPDIKGQRARPAEEGSLERQLHAPALGRIADELYAKPRQSFMRSPALLVTASGVFVEMQTALNVIWCAQPKGDTITRVIRARAASLGLVATLGFMLLVSLVISAMLSAIGSYIDRVIPFGHVILRIIYLAVSFALVSAMFAAIYKVLPDRDIAWRDVRLGAIVSAALFTIGKYLISLYIGSSAIVTSYGAAASVIVMLIWLYYSAQIFLVGAVFTKVYAMRRGSRTGQASPS